MRELLKTRQVKVAPKPVAQLLGRRGEVVLGQVQRVPVPSEPAPFQGGAFLQQEAEEDDVEDDEAEEDKLFSDEDEGGSSDASASVDDGGGEEGRNAPTVTNNASEGATSVHSDDGGFIVDSDDEAGNLPPIVSNHTADDGASVHSDDGGFIVDSGDDQYDGNGGVGTFANYPEFVPTQSPPDHALGHSQGAHVEDASQGGTDGVTSDQGGFLVDSASDTEVPQQPQPQRAINDREVTESKGDASHQKVQIEVYVASVVNGVLPTHPSVWSPCAWGVHGRVCACTRVCVYGVCVVLLCVCIAGLLETWTRLPPRNHPTCFRRPCLEARRRVTLPRHTRVWNWRHPPMYLHLHRPTNHKQGNQPCQTTSFWWIRTLTQVTMRALSSPAMMMVAIAMKAVSMATTPQHSPTQMSKGRWWGLQRLGLPHRMCATVPRAPRNCQRRHNRRYSPR